MSEAPKTSPSTPSQPAPAAPQAAQAQKPATDKRHERLLVVYSPLVGTRVTVFLFDGAIFEGTLDSFVTEGEFALILRMATMVRPGREVIDPAIKAGMTFELMNIRFDDMAELKSAGKNEGGIGTDAAISKKKGNFGRERELVSWVPDGDAGEVLNLSNNTQGTGNWDQFAANEKLFGLKTDFNEEIYTTKLDRQAAHIKAKEAEADRIAREIMASPTSNLHLAEERGKEVAVDEESLYGAVIREKPPGFNAAAEAKTEPPKSALNPNAQEFKLNVNATEFKPSSMTYYNRPRRNLNYGGYNQYNYAPMPYYYVDPAAMPMSVPVPVAAPVPVVAPEAAPAPADTSAAPASKGMNPNAAAFFMPTYFVPSQPAYGYYAMPPPQASYGYYSPQPSQSGSEQKSDSQ